MHIENAFEGINLIGNMNNIRKATIKIGHAAPKHASIIARKNNNCTFVYHAETSLKKTKHMPRSIREGLPESL